MKLLMMYVISHNENLAVWMKTKSNLLFSSRKHVACSNSKSLSLHIIKFCDLMADNPRETTRFMGPDRGHQASITKTMSLKDDTQITGQYPKTWN